MRQQHLVDAWGTIFCHLANTLTDTHTIGFYLKANRCGVMRFAHPHQAKAFQMAKGKAAPSWLVEGAAFGAAWLMAKQSVIGPLKAPVNLTACPATGVLFG